jgi:hypothetical protein
LARDIADIIKELDAGYDPGRQLVQKKLAEAPAAFQAQEAGLKAQEQDYFDNTILTGARQRGMGFSGIPEGERARYGATQYMPAVAKLKTSQNDYQGSLTSALNDINLDQRKTAMGIRQTELDREEQQRQFNETLAAQERARASSGGGGGGGFSPTLSMPTLDTASTAPKGPSLQTFLAQKYASKPNALRSEQDQWVREFAVASGSNANDPTLWAAYDKLYPWAQYNDAVRTQKKITQPGGTVRTGGSSALTTSSGVPLRPGTFTIGGR